MTCGLLTVSEGQSLSPVLGFVYDLVAEYCAAEYIKDDDGLLRHMLERSDIPNGFKDVMREFEVSEG